MTFWYNTIRKPTVLANLGESRATERLPIVVSAIARCSSGYGTDTCSNEKKKNQKREHLSPDDETTAMYRCFFFLRFVSNVLRRLGVRPRRTVMPLVTRGRCQPYRVSQTCLTNQTTLVLFFKFNFSLLKLLILNSNSKFLKIFRKFSALTIRTQISSRWFSTHFFEFVTV